MLWVPEDHNGPYYCSVECMNYGKIEGQRDQADTETPSGPGPEALSNPSGREDEIEAALKELEMA